MAQFLEHTGSYYAATVNRRTDFRPLEGASRADVCVIGAGFTGISTALHLVESGYDVCVLEANRVGWGASGRNGGQVIGGISGEQHMAAELGAETAKILQRLRWEGHDIIRRRVRDHSIECDLKYGYLDVAIKRRHMAKLEAEFSLLQQQGFPHEIRLLSAVETREMIGTGAYTGALLNMANGHLHPLNLCIGEALAAHGLGVRIHEHSPVTEIARRRRPRVITDKGSVDCEFVVLAGNAYHALESELRGIMLPFRSYIIATEPLGEDTVRRINPRDVAVCDPNFVLEYFRLSADRRLLFGGRCNYFGEDPAEITRQLRPRMLKIYPQLADAGIEYAWGGTIGVPLNRVPQMGRLAPNIVYCQGYTGHGVNVTHLAGRILADAVAGTLEHFDLFSGMKTPRLPGASRFARAWVSMAVMYYRMRDRL